MNMRACLGSLAIVGLAGLVHGQTIDPFFSGSYSYVDLGSAPGVPTNYGGLTMLAGTTDTLLLGGAANGASGSLWAVKVSRDAGNHINGIISAERWGDAPNNDGGVAYGPGGVLFASQWPANKLSQYKPGSTSPDKVIDLAPLGAAQSHSAVNFVPSDYTAAGRMKLSSWAGGQFYDATFAPDGSGTYDITALAQTATLSGGPEGFAYVPLNSPLINGEAMIVSEYSANTVAIYDVDANGDPLAATRRTFMTGLSGAEGAFIDPVTGDFLFSTFGGGNRIIAVRGFAIPTPGAAGLLALAGMTIVRRRR